MREIEGENGKEQLMGTLVHYCMIILSGHERWLSFLIVVVNLLSNPCWSPESWLVRACISMKQNKSKPQRCCKTKS